MALTAKVTYKRCGVCPLVLKFDNYQGCTHNCMYCSVRWERQNPHRRSVNLPKTNENLAAQLRGEHPDEATPFLLAKYAVQVGIRTDPFQHSERKYKLTYEALQIFKQFEIPVYLCTKSAMWAEEPWYSLIKSMKDLVTVRVSFSTVDDEVAKLIEPGTSMPSERLAAMKKAKADGITALFRLIPYIHKVTFKSMEELDHLCALSAEAACYAHVKDLTIIPHANKATFRPMFAKLGIDFDSYVKKYYTEGSGLYRVMPSELMKKVTLQLLDRWRKHGLRCAAEIPGNWSWKNIDGCHCCAANPSPHFQKQYARDSLIPMYRDGRLKSLDFVDDVRYPSDYKGMVRDALRGVIASEKSTGKTS